MVNPAIRSEGGARRFVVHAAHEGRDRGKVVRATGFEAAALAFAETWRPTPDPEGAVHLVLTDLDSGERQEAAVDVARPGVVDLQIRRARLEARVARRPETPPGSERFAIGPITTAEPPMAHAKTPDLRRWLVSAAAGLAVALVAAALVTLLVRDRMSHAPWVDAAAPAPTARPALPSAEAPRLRAAVLQPAADPAAIPPEAPPRAAAPARPAPRRTAAVAPGDGVLALPAPDIAPEPLVLPPPDAPLQVPAQAVDPAADAARPETGEPSPLP